MVVRAELPGIDLDKDVEITVFEGMLRSAFRYGSFDRSLPLPLGASEETKG